MATKAELTTGSASAATEHTEEPQLAELVNQEACLGSGASARTRGGGNVRSGVLSDGTKEEPDGACPACKSRPPPVELTLHFANGESATGLVPCLTCVWSAHLAVAGSLPWTRNSRRSEFTWTRNGTPVDGGELIANWHCCGRLVLCVDVRRPGVLPDMELMPNCCEGRGCLWTAMHVALWRLPRSATGVLPAYPGLLKVQIVRYMLEHASNLVWSWDGRTPSGEITTWPKYCCEIGKAASPAGVTEALAAARCYRISVYISIGKLGGQLHRLGNGLWWIGLRWTDESGHGHFDAMSAASKQRMFVDYAPEGVPLPRRGFPYRGAGVCAGEYEPSPSPSKASVADCEAVRVAQERAHGKRAQERAPDFAEDGETSNHTADIFCGPQSPILDAS
jgi:hypothetical protein